jgi:hypothetical protein
MDEVLSSARIHLDVEETRIGVPFTQPSDPRSLASTGTLDRRKAENPQLKGFPQVEFLRGHAAALLSHI